jgi:hypothetical protein
MAGRSFKVAWSGFFEQMGIQSDFAFEDLQIDLDGDIKGGGYDSVGQYSFEGNFTKDKIHFSKQYADRHRIHYSGQYDNGNEVTGKWDIAKNSTGQFKLKMKCDLWKGWYEHNGEKTEMTINMIVQNNGVFGLGADKIGQFIMNGYHKNHCSTCTFIKQYVGKSYQIHYSGSLVISKKKNTRVVKGVWMVPGGGESNHGYFKLREE